MRRMLLGAQLFVNKPLITSQRCGGTWVKAEDAEVLGAQLLDLALEGRERRWFGEEEP
jgi:hypothetical protein